jgi:hypothetical protein
MRRQQMALLTVEGVYREGKVELGETPVGVGEPARVLVTFLPAPSTTEAEGHPMHRANSDGDQAVMATLPDQENARHAALQRLLARLKQGIDFGGPPYPKREELYDRINRSGDRDD